MNAKTGRADMIFAGFWIVAALLNAWFGYSMHLLVDWIVAAGCLVVAGMYALRVTRK